MLLTSRRLIQRKQIDIESDMRGTLREQYDVLHEMLLKRVRPDPVYRRFMTVLAVGPIAALTYRASVDQPRQFLHARSEPMQA